MKKIKLKFIGFWGGMNPQELRLYRTLKKYYDVELSDKPDYIICSCYDAKMEFTKYPQVRIFMSGENFAPDFNLIDYAFSPYPIEFNDRVLYSPQFLSGYDGYRKDFFSKERSYSKDFLKEKTRFANFIASHESEFGIRGNFFKKLSEYKQVDSPGSYMHNVDESIKVNWKDNSKTDFQRTCKFSLCFESTSHRGFSSEKIMDAFYAETIPVYYGDPDIIKAFNSKRFVNCHEYSSFEEVIDKIIELDNDDDAYLNMMNQPIFNNPDYINEYLERYEEYVRYIFDQPLEKAYRRSLVAWPKAYNDYLASMITMGEIRGKILKPWRKISAHYNRKYKKNSFPQWFLGKVE